jgi:cytosine/adenosine deaminase-related metal-dependent hydrolase
MTKNALLLLVSVLALATGGLRTSRVPALATDQAAFDMVILGGRVMDPESGLDAVRNIGIRDGKIVEISEAPLLGKQNINARGLVVAPGFIDLHEHGQDPRNYEFQAHDGVTTSLELEAGTADVSGWYAQRAGKSLINFGVSAGHIPIRMRVMNDSGKWMPTGPAAHKAASPEQLRAIQQELEAGLKAGALAVGMGINYTEAATHQEILEMFRVAAKY